ncbi:hypothetical protein BDB01DRAFT_728593, partial [Pilobolus umbonatus]
IILFSFDVQAPKGKCSRRRIIKSFTVKAHSDPRLCPVATFLVFQEHRPSCLASTLFVNSIQPDKPLCVRTIQKWISKLLRLSTTESRVSLRSIASSLALQLGIPKEDIITMGNWAASTTFEHPYRREHLSTFDFTNTLLPSASESTSEDQEVFFDAVGF